MFETLEGLSFVLLFKLKVHVTASFSADLRDKGQRKTSRVEEQRHSCMAPTREAAAEASVRNVCGKNRPTGVNERSFVKKFVRENLKRIIFECSNIRCSSREQSRKGARRAGTMVAANSRD